MDYLVVGRKMNEYVAIVINAFCVGIGASLGNYFTTRLFIKRLDGRKEKVKNVA